MIRNPFKVGDVVECVTDEYEKRYGIYKGQLCVLCHPPGADVEAFCYPPGVKTGNGLSFHQFKLAHEARRAKEDGNDYENAIIAQDIMKEILND